MNATEKKWTQFATTHLVGRKISSARYLTPDEADGLGWSQRCVVLTLDDGTMLYPSSDDEGNEAGTLFGSNKRNTDLTFPVIS